MFILINSMVEYWNVAISLPIGRISDANLILLQAGLIMYLLSLIFFNLFTITSNYNISEDLSKSNYRGRVIFGWINFKGKARKIAIEFLYPQTSLKWKRKIIEQTAVEALIVVLYVYCGIFIYESLLFDQEIWFRNLLTRSNLSVGNQLKALGSLTLAVEAVFAGFRQFADYSNTRFPLPEEHQILIEERVKQYTLRFCGALTLASGYIFVTLPSTRNLFVFPMVALGVSFITLLLANGIIRSIAIFSGVASAISLLLGFVLSMDMSPTMILVFPVLLIPFHKMARQSGRPIWYQSLLRRLGFNNVDE